ncbi:hypothetical protein D3C71_1785540 [compost metagenome]
MLAGFLASRANRPICSRVMPSSTADFSRNWPVPAAHLSFMTNSTTLPVFRSTLIALESWPPMSMMVRVWGYRAWAPMAWQDISVTTSKGMSSKASTIRP